MNFFQAIILGIVQALTEYLPVSSSAHIRIIGDLMLGADPGAHSPPSSRSAPSSR